MLKIEDRVLTSSYEIRSQYPDKFMVFQYLEEDDYMDPGYMLYICDTRDEAISIESDLLRTLENVTIVEGRDWWNVL
ncbi:MAG: hypothetical protein FWG68_01545 [Defluviitaleaceae bacterium]|nr:hypothetical protein [Defluviitaleaceae bacterium]